MTHIHSVLSAEGWWKVARSTVGSKRFA